MIFFRTSIVAILATLVTKSWAGSDSSSTESSSRSTSASSTFSQDTPSTIQEDPGVTTQPVPSLGPNEQADVASGQRNLLLAKSPYFMWEASKWGPRGYANSTATLDTAELEAALTEMSDANNGLGITATVYDADGNQVSQTTVGDRYCQGPNDYIDLFDHEKICSNETKFVSGWDENTVFAAYSNSKVVSAMVFLASVVQTGLGTLDEPVGESLPQYFDGSTAEHQSITPRQIFSHTSGIPFEYALQPEEFDQCFQREGNPLPSLEDCVTWIAGYPLQHPPGTQYENSELAFEIIAALILEKTGSSLEDNFQQYIAQPLGLTSTTYVCPWVPSTAEHPQPAVGLCTTGVEYAKIVQMLANGGITPEGDQILTPSSHDQVLSTQTRKANLISNSTPFLITPAGGLSSLRCRPGEDGEISQIGYGLGAFQNTGTKAEVWGHPSLMGSKWLVAPGLYSMYIATSYPFNFADPWLLRVQDRFESASTFSVNPFGSGSDEGKDLTVCGDLWPISPAVGEPLPAPAVYFNLTSSDGDGNAETGSPN